MHTRFLHLLMVVIFVLFTAFSGSAETSEIPGIKNSPDDVVVYTPCTIHQAKALPDNTGVLIEGVVTAGFADHYYIQNTSGICGIAVQTTKSIPVDSNVRVPGILRTMQSGERYVLLDESSVDYSEIESDVKTRPVYINNRNMGESVYNGPVGLLVKTTGRITYISDDKTFAYIDDGSNLIDGVTIDKSGEPVTGLRVLLPQDIVIPKAGRNICTAGILSCERINGSIIRVLKPRSQTDIILQQGSIICGRINSRVSYPVESLHPYFPNTNNIYRFTGPPGTVQMRIHFTNIELGSANDNLTLRDSAAVEKQMWNGGTCLSDCWSDWIAGSFVDLAFTSDASNQLWGFQVDCCEFKLSNSCLAGVTISIEPGGHTVLTGNDGTFVFDGLPQGTYTVTAAREGTVFVPESKTVALHNGQIQRCEFSVVDVCTELLYPLPDGSTTPMVWISPGSFLMGNTGSEPFTYKDEHPQHSVALSGYWIGKYEVTREEYGRFIACGGYSNSAYWSGDGWAWKISNNITKPMYWSSIQNWGTGDFIQTDGHPVVGVTYFEAEAFCKWAGLSLPTEAQWEKAARWDGHSRIYPWGDLWNFEYSNNYRDHSLAAGGYQKWQTAPVGCYPGGVSYYGCYDMAGNVYEWCKDWYQSNYYSRMPADGWVDPQGPSSGSQNSKVIRGGSWFEVGYDDATRGAYRGICSWDLSFNDVGFRVAR